MQELTDKQIQELLEGGLPASGAGRLPGDKNFETYRLLFDALRQEPEAALPYNLSAKVVGRLQADRDRVISFKFHWLPAAIAFFFLLIAYFYIAFMNYASADVLVNAFLKYKWVAFFGVACYLLVQYLDQKLVKEKYPDLTQTA